MHNTWGERRPGGGRANPGKDALDGGGLFFKVCRRLKLLNRGQFNDGSLFTVERGGREEKMAKVEH